MLLNDFKILVGYAKYRMTLYYSLSDRKRSFLLPHSDFYVGILVQANSATPHDHIDIFKEIRTLGKNFENKSWSKFWRKETVLRYSVFYCDALYYGASCSLSSGDLLKSRSINEYELWIEFWGWGEVSWQ